MSLPIDADRPLIRGAEKDERDAWSTSHLTSLKRRDALNRETFPAWVRNFHSPQRQPGMGLADRFGGPASLDKRGVIHVKPSLAWGKGSSLLAYHDPKARAC